MAVTLQPATSAVPISSLNSRSSIVSSAEATLSVALLSSSPAEDFASCYTWKVQAIGLSAIITASRLVCDRRMHPLSELSRIAQDEAAKFLARAPAKQFSDLLTNASMILICWL